MSGAGKFPEFLKRGASSQDEGDGLPALHPMFTALLTALKMERARNPNGRTKTIYLDSRTAFELREFLEREEGRHALPPPPLPMEPIVKFPERVPPLILMGLAAAFACLGGFIGQVFAALMQSGP